MPVPCGKQTKPLVLHYIELFITRHRFFWNIPERTKALDLVFVFVLANEEAINTAFNSFEAAWSLSGVVWLCCSTGFDEIF